jgi:sigma-E factor negative regulatory protein RseA
MTEQFDEKFSAFMDGELEGSAQDQVIKRICQDEECKQRWQSYHMISDTLRRNLPSTLNPSFSHSVMKALESEPTILAPTRSKPALSPVTKRIAGAAIAASVAAVAVISVQTSNTTNDQAATLAEMPASKEFVRMVRPNQVTDNTTGTAPALTASVTPLETQEAQVSTVKKFHPQLNKYLVDHSQHVSGTRVQGIMPYARIVVSPSESQQGNPQR